MIKCIPCVLRYALYNLLFPKASDLVFGVSKFLAQNLDERSMEGLHRFIKSDSHLVSVL